MKISISNSTVKISLLFIFDIHFTAKYKIKFDMLCISRILLFSITTIIFDSMTLFDVTLRESTWKLFWPCGNHAYYLLIAVLLISLLPYALSALSSVSFFYSPFQTHNLLNTVVPFAF